MISSNSIQYFWRKYLFPSTYVHLCWTDTGISWFRDRSLPANCSTHSACPEKIRKPHSNQVSWISTGTWYAFVFTHVRCSYCIAFQYVRNYALIHWLVWSNNQAREMNIIFHCWGIALLSFHFSSLTWECQWTIWIWIVLVLVLRPYGSWKC